MFNACSQRPLRTRYWGTPASFDKDTRGVVKLGAQASTKPQRSLNEASTKPQRSFNEIDTCCQELSLTPVYRTHSTGNKHALPMFHVLNIIIACVAHATRPVGHRPAHRVAFGMNVADVLLPCCSSHRTSGGPTNWYGSLFSYKPLSPNTYTICGTHWGRPEFREIYRKIWQRRRRRRNFSKFATHRSTCLPEAHTVHMYRIS